MRNILDNRRAAFSIKELLVVILIVGTLIAVLVPPIQKVQEAQARTNSTNNLKAIGLAAHTFHDMHKRLPFNGSSVAVKDEPYSLNAVANQPRSGSWAFQIAPFMDQRPMFTAGTSDTGIALLMCPGRGRPLTSNTPAVGATTPPWSDYVINPWLNDNLNGGGLTTNSAVQDNQRTLVGITDGTSNTIFFGQGQINTQDYWRRDATPGYMDTILIGGTTATALSSNVAAGPVTFERDSSETRRDAARGWGSPWAQGCLMCMGDATVRMFPYSITVGSFKDGVGMPVTANNLATFLTPTGGEVLTLCDT
jgi:type II secretory pathway pseudopilin PulG